jgi:hypothetical protein
VSQGSLGDGAEDAAITKECRGYGYECALLRGHHTPVCQLTRCGADGRGWLASASEGGAGSDVRVWSLAWHATDRTIRSAVLCVVATGRGPHQSVVSLGEPLISQSQPTLVCTYMCCIYLVASVHSTSVGTTKNCLWKCPSGGGPKARSGPGLGWRARLGCPERLPIADATRAAWWRPRAMCGYRWLVGRDWPRARERVPL